MGKELKNVGIILRIQLNFIPDRKTKTLSQNIYEKIEKWGVQKGDKNLENNPADH